MYINAHVNGDLINDEIMQMIRAEQENKYMAPSNVINITDAEIMVGHKGRKINLRRSYNKMRQVNAYTPDLLVYDLIYPNNSLKNNLDKYIVRGNPKRKGISLIFKTNNKGDMDIITSILNKRQVVGTFITNNIKTNTKEQELINLNTSDFCYTEEVNAHTLDICRRRGKATIKPEVVDTRLYSYVKNNAKIGSLIQINVNQDNIDELGITIDYLLARGFKIVPLTKHISEQI
jgi:hypothetical protein